MRFPILIISSLYFGRSTRTSQFEKEGHDPIYQISNDHGFNAGKDSVVLIKSFGDFPFFDKVQVFRGKQSLLNYTEKDLEIIGTPMNCFVEHNNGHGEYFYIVRIFNGPGPDKFLIIKTTENKATIFGTTEPNSAEIFGDVDYDGKFEIGGLTRYCQGGDKNCHPKDYYKVFEIDDNFPTDNVLTDYFKQFLREK